MIETRIDIATKFDVEGFVRFAGERLGIMGSVKLNIYPNDSLLERFSTGDHLYEALLYQAMPGTYNLVVRSNIGAGLKSVLAHEMIHLQQYVSGRLQMSVMTGAAIWEGESFPASVPYEERPWEREAFKQERDLLKAYRKQNRRRCVL